VTILLLFHLATALVAPRLSSFLGRRTFLVAALAPAATVAWAIVQAPGILGGAAVIETTPWAPALGLELSLRIDAFALLMVVLVSGIGVLIFVYSRWYFSDRPDVGRLASLLVAFAGAMLGLVVADNMLALFLFWEVTSITSYLLIGFDDRSAAARAAALRALLITAAGGLAMLGGFVLIAQQAGTYSLSQVLAGSPAGPLIEIALLLVLFGAFAKSAQVPFHFWLPGAMAAPTPVSAYLHSATMVKAGVYLIARLAPAFADVPLWRPLVIGVGLATMLVGGWRALAQRDLKLLLAHGTTSQLGLLVVLFGAGFAQATLAGAALILAHAAFKAALFMVVGIVDHATGTRDITRLDALHRPLRATFVVAAIAAASMAGLPPLFGFIAKEGAFAAFAGGAGGGWDGLVLAVLVVGAILTVAYSARFLWGAFASKPRAALAADHVAASISRPSWPFLAPAALLSLATVVCGLWPRVVSDLTLTSARALDPRVPETFLALWHGFNEPLVLSVVALAGGVLLFRGHRAVRAVRERFRLPFDGAWVHDQAVGLFLHVAGVVTGHMQTGSLPMYLLVILGTVLLVPGTILLTEIDLDLALPLVDRPMQLTIAVIVIMATAVAIGSPLRMVAVLAVGVVGYAVAAIFIVQGAPDLALTQLLIETLLLVLFVLILRHLPPTFRERSTGQWRVLRVVTSIGVGLFAAVATLTAGAARRADPVSVEYLGRALPEGDGRNVVNVILVDFRAFDTFGEILVLTTAALGVVGLIRAVRREREHHQAAGKGTFQRYQPSFVLDTAVQLLFHTVLLFSVVLLVVGHDRPGGGFIGGLVAGAAFILVFLAGGEPAVRRAEPMPPELLLGSGITLAAAVGALGWIAGGEFLEAMVFAGHFPVVGAVKVGSVFVFDVGVYLVVTGLVMALLRSAGHEEMRVP
jgi:multicomponent Na+:H+ antiporter subunit A